jgi:dCMP deaminase
MENAKPKRRRMDREVWYLRIAEVIAERSSCTRAKVGAVLVDPTTHHIVSMGYNGSTKGGPHCTDMGCLMYKKHCIRTIHAELNAVLHLERQYQYLYLYCTHQPCYQCIKALVGAGVITIYYKKEYEDKARDLLLKELPNLKLIKVTRSYK